MSGHALYVGQVRHRRSRPKVHALAYRIYMLLIDLETPIPRSWVLKAGRFGLMSFDPTDHGDGSQRPLRDQAIDRLRAAGMTGPVGRVQLLTMPRVLGYGFNPISIYWCHRPDGSLAGIVHEVSNTFGEHLHVSPFMDMDMDYAFRLTPPGETVEVVIDLKDAQGVILTASFIGEARPLTDAALVKAWLAHPLLTLKVIGGIHWEAVRIWLKGVRYRRKPPPPVEPVTVARSAGSRA